MQHAISSLPRHHLTFSHTPLEFVGWTALCTVVGFYTLQRFSGKMLAMWMGGRTRFHRQFPSREDKLIAGHRLVGFTHGVISAILAIVSILMAELDHELWGDKMCHTPFPLFRLFAMSLTGTYMLYDMAFSRVNRVLWDMQMVFHHICAFVSIAFPILLGGAGSLLIIGAQFMEISTPFMHARRHYIQTKQTGTLSFKLVNVFFVLAFIISRLVFYPGQLIWSAQNFWLLTAGCGYGLTLWVLVGGTAFWFFNLWWFYGIVRSLKKYVFGEGHIEEKEGSVTYQDDRGMPDKDKEELAEFARQTAGSNDNNNNNSNHVDDKATEAEELRRTLRRSSAAGRLESCTHNANRILRRNC